MLISFPPLDADRLAAVRTAAGSLPVLNTDTPAEALAAMPAATAFFGKLTPDLLAAGPSLRWVQSPTASLEHYLFPELIAHPCTLTNMRGLFSDVVADHVFGFVLCFARNLHVYIRRQAERRWEPVGDGTTTNFAAGPSAESGIDRAHRHLADHTLGVVGVGAIGAEICRRAAAFGMTVRGVDPHPRPLPSVEVWPLERLDELLGACDFVVIAAPHTPRTAGLFDADRIARMKSGAILVNVGRGAIVRTEDLVAALRSGHLGGAALDVCETEPLPADSPLWGMGNVIVTPHVAAASPRVPQRHRATLIENVRRFVAGEPLLNVVEKGEWC